MIDKYDSMQNQIGCEINELTDAKKYIDEDFTDNNIGIIRDKRKMCGMSHHKMLGYIVGDEYYKVKLQTNDAILLITMRKEGKVLHILEDKTQGEI